MKELEGKVALVTGGTSGIGRAAVDALLRQGASVALCGVDAQGADAAEAELAADATRVHLSVVDVTREDEVRDWVAGAAEHFGGLDVVVTAAGVQTYGSTTTTELPLWRRTLEVNVTGAYLVLRHALPHLRERGGGAVVAVSSVQAFVSQAGVAAYSASKGALNALVRSVAIDEAPHGIRANAVCPGSVDTPMLRSSARRHSDGTPEGERQLLRQWGAAHPLGRVGRASEVGEVIAFLAGQRASFVTGAALPVDGGLLASIAVALPE